MPYRFGSTQGMRQAMTLACAHGLASVLCCCHHAWRKPSQQTLPRSTEHIQNISVACVVAHLLQLFPVCLCILRQNRQGLRDAELVRTGCSLWALHGVAPLSKLMLYVLA